MPRRPRQPAGIDAFAERMRQDGYTESSITTYRRTVAAWWRSSTPALDWLIAAQRRSAVGSGPPTASARSAQSALRAWHRFSGLDEAPLLRLPTPIRYRRVRPVQEPLTLHEERAAIAWILALRDVRTRMFMELLFDTGARIFEIRTLKLEHVGMVDGVALDVTGKGVRFRRIPLLAPTAHDLSAYLRGWRGGRRGDWLFPGQVDAQPLSIPPIARACRRLAAHLGRPRLTPHTFRHTLSTRMLEAEIAPKIAGTILGHAVPGMVAHYQHPDTTLCRRALARVRAWRLAPPGSPTGRGG